MDVSHLHSPHTLEDEWPVQRLRLAVGGILFFMFEMLIGRQLPPQIAYMALGLGCAAAVSSAYTVRELADRARLVPAPSFAPARSRARSRRSAADE